MTPIRSLVSTAAAAAVVAVGLVATTMTPASAAPSFEAPFPCGQSWTYDHHANEVRRALDFVSNDGATDGAPVLASAAGTVTHRYEEGGAGNYVVMDHGGGWQTYYFHLSAYSVPDGATVAQGDQIGVTGSTGASTGAHQHYEQLLDGVGQDVVIDGVPLAYPSQYGEASLTSTNCGGGTPPPAPEGIPFQTYGDGVSVRAEPSTSAAVVGSLAGPSTVRVVCQTLGETVTAEGYTNAWWSRLSGNGDGYMTNIYVQSAGDKLPGVPDC